MGSGRTRTTRLVWSTRDEATLLERYREGGVAAAIAAFPDRDRKSTAAALRRARYFRPTHQPAVVCDRELVRAAIAALPYDTLCERLCALVRRNADVEGVA
jgi:hypothetical protein